MSFVHFNDTLQQFALFGCHCLSNSVLDTQGGRLPESNISGNPVATQPFFGIQHQRQNSEPFRQFQMSVVENCPDSNRI